MAMRDTIRANAAPLLQPGEETEVESQTPGALLATVRFADHRWVPPDFTKALLIYEHCLVYSGGRSRDFDAWSRKERRGIAKVDASGRTPRTRWFDERVAADAELGPVDLAAAHAENWIVWSGEVREWHLRGGIATSRLRLKLADGTRRKVLWGHTGNALAALSAALERTLAN